MTENEQELINLIQSHAHPEKALQIAVDIILAFLEQDLSSQEPQIASPAVSCEIR